MLAQQAIEKRGLRNHDLLRTGRLALYGGCVFAPIVARWYMLLERLPIRSRPALIATKVGLDQFVLTPAILGVFFSSMTILEGKGTDEIRSRLKTAWQPTLVRNWMLFIPTQIANFSIVPVQFRLLVVNVVSLFWNCYLSYANSKSSQGQISEVEEKVENKIKAIV